MIGPNEENVRALLGEPKDDQVDRGSPTEDDFDFTTQESAIRTLLENTRIAERIAENFTSAALIATVIGIILSSLFGKNIRNFIQEIDLNLLSDPDRPPPTASLPDNAAITPTQAIPEATATPTEVSTNQDEQEEDSIY